MPFLRHRNTALHSTTCWKKKYKDSLPQSSFGVLGLSSYCNTPALLWDTSSHLKTIQVLCPNVLNGNVMRLNMSCMIYLWCYSVYLCHVLLSHDFFLSCVQCKKNIKSSNRVEEVNDWPVIATWKTNALRWLMYVYKSRNCRTIIFRNCRTLYFFSFYCGSRISRTSS